MSTQLELELIQPDGLVARARALKAEGWRLVQIGATRLPDAVELTYSFDQANRLLNLRLQFAGPDAAVPSLTGVYWCAFLYENELHDLFGITVQGNAVDFQGNLYKTAVQFPFGATPPPKAPTPTTS